MVRSRLAALLRATVRMQRLAALTRLAELVAARRHGRGGWEIALVRHGRLAAAGVSPPGVHPRPTLDAAPGHRRDGPARTRARCRRATAEETERILAWLERPETRLVETTSGWASPARGAARFRDLLAKAEKRRRPHQILDRTLIGN